MVCVVSVLSLAADAVSARRPSAAGAFGMLSSIRLAMAPAFSPVAARVGLAVDGDSMPMAKGLCRCNFF